MENKGIITSQPIRTKAPDIITITSEDGKRIIMRIDPDGNYHGDLADASEAARAFCLEVQKRLREFADQNRILLMESAKQ